LHRAHRTFSRRSQPKASQRGTNRDGSPRTSPRNRGSPSIVVLVRHSPSPLVRAPMTVSRASSDNFVMSGIGPLGRAA